MTRAQEAEENYAIKRELAVVKQQYYTATENLQSAQNLIRQLQDKQVGGPLHDLPGSLGSFFFFFSLYLSYSQICYHRRNA